MYTISRSCFGHEEYCEEIMINKIVLSGGWGYGNYGDEAILKYMLIDLRRYFPSKDIVILSYDREMTFCNHKCSSYDSLHRIARNMRGNTICILKRLIDCDQVEEGIKEYEKLFDEQTLFIMGGGGYFNDIWRESFWARIAEIHIAKKKGSKVAIFAQTIGPVTKGRNILNRYLKMCDYVVTRDKTSYDYVTTIMGNRVMYGPDAAVRVGHYYVRKESTGGCKRMMVMFQRLRPYTGIDTSYLAYRIGQFINILTHRNRRFENEILDCIRFFQNEGYNVSVVLSTNWHIDRVKRVLKRGGMEAGIILCEDVNQFIKKISDQDIVVSTNMHPAIIATNLGIPTLTLSHTYKITDYMNSIGMERFNIIVKGRIKETSGLFEEMVNDSESGRIQSCLEKESLRMQNELDAIYEGLRNCVKDIE